VGVSVWVTLCELYGARYVYLASWKSWWGGRLLWLVLGLCFLRVLLGVVKLGICVRLFDGVGVVEWEEGGFVW
jgi:hypothetical protein